MDRRRFAPTTERLDERVLLTTAAPNLVSATAVLNLEKTTTIARFGNLLDSEAPGRIVPETLVAPLQNDLTAVVGKLSDPGGPALVVFNQQLRGTLKHSTINAADTAGLNATFGNALTASGVPIPVTNAFQTDMQNLLTFDEQNPNQTAMAARDYANVFDMALEVGRPIPTPTAPRLLATGSAGTQGLHITSSASPTLAGTYNYAGATITLLDQAGNSLGKQQVSANGTYQIQVNRPLAAGTYYFRVQATDPDGDTSRAGLSCRVVVQAD